MARKTFDEILKDREKEKKNGTYNTGTDSNERPTADEVIAKREYAIQKRRYKSDFYQGGRKKDRNAGVKYSKSGAYVETSGGTGTWEEQKHRSEYTGNTLYGTKGLFGKEYFGTKPKVPTYQEMKAKSTGEKPKSKESKKYIGEYEAVRELKNLGVSDEDIAKIKKRKLGKSDWSVELESARKIKQTEKERKAGTYVDESYRKYLDNIKQQTSELESIGGNTEEIAKKKDWLNKQHENIKILNDKETAEIVEKYAELKDSNEISSRLRNEAKGLQSPKVAEFDRLTDDLKKKGYDEKQINSLYDTYKRIKNAKASKQYEQNLEKDLKKERRCIIC